jgi:N-acylneuraminate cytidylyltransferase
MKKNVTAYIPVRGGSKGIPKKNIKEIGGKPLAHWVMEACFGCDYIDRVAVATDSKEIADVAGQLENPKLDIFYRDYENCTDTASTEMAMIEYCTKNSDFDYILLVQATSPLLKAEHLNDALRKFFDSDKDTMLSLVRQLRFIWKENPDGTVEPLNYTPATRPRRQDFDGILVENGAFYLTSRERMLGAECRLSGRIMGYEMPEETYFEIDSEEDWKIVDSMIRKLEER